MSYISLKDLAKDLETVSGAAIDITLAGPDGPVRVAFQYTIPIDVVAKGPRDSFVHLVGFMRQLEDVVGKQLKAELAAAQEEIAHLELLVSRYEDALALTRGESLK